MECIVHIFQTKIPQNLASTAAAHTPRTPPHPAVDDAMASLADTICKCKEAGDVLDEQLEAGSIDERQWKALKRGLNHEVKTAMKAARTSAKPPAAAPATGAAAGLNASEIDWPAWREIERVQQQYRSMEAAGDAMRKAVGAGAEWLTRPCGLGNVKTQQKHATKDGMLFYIGYSTVDKHFYIKMAGEGTDELVFEEEPTLFKLAQVRIIFVLRAYCEYY